MDPTARGLHIAPPPTTVTAVASVRLAAIRMASLLVLGFLIGMRHALEADHVAAVASLVSGRRSMSATVRHGVTWGVGHTATLFAVSAVVMVTGAAIPARLAGALELMVGLMLVGLGVDVVRRLVRDRVHFHLHQHRDGSSHLHAHSHAGEPREAHEPTRHSHQHAGRFPVRALLVGLMHGMAGSAALVVVTASTVDSVGIGLLYVALFGIGSMLGMGLLSVAIAVPLRAAARGLTWLHNGLHAAVGAATVVVGALLVARTAATLLAGGAA